MHLPPCRPYDPRATDGQPHEPRSADVSSDASADLHALVELLLRMHSERVEDGGSPRGWNRLADEVQRLQLRLSKSEVGRAGITALVDHDCATVSGWAAAWSLFWDETRSREHLTRAAARPGLEAFGAAITLREFDAGRLDMTWVPRRPRPRAADSR